MGYDPSVHVAGKLIAQSGQEKYNTTIGGEDASGISRILAVTAAGELIPSAGMGSLLSGKDIYMLDNSNSMSHGTTARDAANADQIDITGFLGTSFPIEAIIEIQRYNASSIYQERFTPQVDTISFSSAFAGGAATLDIVGMEAGATDKFVIIVRATERGAPSTTAVALVAAQDLTNAYVDYGAEIVMLERNRLGIYVVVDANNSEDVDLRVLGKHESGGADEYEIDGISVERLWSGVSADFKKYYEFDVGTIPYIQLQAKAGTVGAPAGDLTIVIDKKWRN